ncbi:hypothetical protein [Acidianus sp. HS-5]|uniref:COG1361 S-layer family protein n=1 Tax=Acidianus sp. HS-5 TaxID=2886040 RepID=UPI001F315A8D|nr:hypothetical protein [Acidianus sp. HS-5]BDC18169.1 hypothetical protein HS5_10590 [Acidianus sp. HS-5]
MKYVTSILIIALLLASYIPLIGNSTTAFYNISGYVKVNGLVAPGQTEVPITFTLINTGETLYNVNITPLSSYPFEVYSGYYNSTDVISIPELQTGQKVNVTFIYNVVPSAKDGIYKIPLKISSTELNKTVYFTLPILGYVQISAQSVWGSLSSPMIVTAGENDVPLTIVLINQGNVMASNVSLCLSSSYPVIFLEKNIKIGYLPVGEEVPITVYASISNNITTGVFYVPIRVNYFCSSYCTVSLPITINGYENFSISTVWGTTSSPITASPGSTQLPLTFIVRNLGDITATNVSIQLLTSYPLNLSQKTVDIGIVPAGEYNLNDITASIYPNATPGIYYIKASVHYFDTSSIEYIPVLISSPQLSLNAITIPPQIFPGYFDVRVEAIILNHGSGIAQNAFIYLKSPFKVVSENNISLGAIPSGVPINATFLINVPNSTKPGNYNLTFVIKYDGGELEKTVNITVYDKADIVIEKVIYPTINPGSSKVPITIILKNIGNATACNVKVILGSSNVITPHVSTSNPLEALTASEQEIGNLKPDQEVNVTYVVDISSGASPGYYPFSVILVWNQTGSLYPLAQTDESTVHVCPTLLSQITSYAIVSIPVIYIIIVAIIIIIIIAIAAARRGKK